MPDADAIMETRLAAARQIATLPEGTFDPDGFAWSQCYRLDVTDLRARLSAAEQERDQAKACIDALEEAMFDVATFDRETGALIGRSRDDLETRVEALRAAEARAEAAAESLRECIPYVNRALNPTDPDNAPWRIETAAGVMERLRAALALREEGQ